MHDAEELRRFARQDWAAAARGKELYWRDWKRKHGAAAGIRMADELRKQVLAQKPGWPSDEERREDWEAHWREIDAFDRLDAWRSRVSRGGEKMGKSHGNVSRRDFFTHHAQSETMDCGLACLRMVRDWLGLEVSEPKLREWWSPEDGIEPNKMRSAIASLVGERSAKLVSRVEVQTLVDVQTANLLSEPEKFLLVLLISYWNEEGYNPRHWIVARDFRKLSNAFSIKGTAKPPRGGELELVALVHDPLQTVPYRQSWQSILAAPVIEGIFLTAR
ncbi:cysteine peptidase family C39 domain-containing protein [Polyangium sp. 15x6]|uniref:cysteine peptidase family C39 domain-containing protein n=1 Tax=Polyangium sp. 15x6 TaxID=3042687 RepID=UPI00249A217F|nr:cysteine peptidase family C39 domain-containing protein [Polyangium sp. 15x6]MDI3285503.1 cysteine peptidase family C39 domain-containing protein [Polyangium sp. 15x6]